MKHVAKYLGIALALGGISPATAGYCPSGTLALGAPVTQTAGSPTVSEDTPDNADGDDPEGGAVVDPVPQDDGSDGVDDGSGDAS